MGGTIDYRDSSDKDDGGNAEGRRTKVMGERGASGGKRTIVVRPSDLAGKKTSESTERVSEPEVAAAGLVVGWLVVVDGPGMGRSLELGIGNNTIGSEEGNRVVINFGDPGISRVAHASIVFDELNCKYFVKDSDSSNLLYIKVGEGWEAVLQMRPIETGATFRLSKTTLRFVALCGDDFKWPE